MSESLEEAQPSQEEAEMCLTEDDVTENDRQGPKDKNQEVKDLKTSQRERRTVGPLSLIKEDFSQFKEEVLKVFRDSKTEPEDRAEDGLVSSTLELLKGDLSQFKEDVTSVFTSRDKSAESKSSQAAEKTNNRLSLFRDDLSGVFRFSLSKDRDAPRPQASKASRGDGAIKSLFKGEKQSSERAEESQSDPEAGTELREEQTDDGPGGNKAETVHDEEKVNNGGINEAEDREGEVTEEKTEDLCETPQCEPVIPSTQTDQQRCESEVEKDDSSMELQDDETIHRIETEEEKEAEAEKKEETDEEEEEEESPPETPLSLLSVIRVFNQRQQDKDDMRDGKEEDPWSVKNFACYLTLDPNTANSELHLTDGNRTATRVWSDHRPFDHPDRFERCPQVLCREGLLDSVYWEVEWSGGADVGVTYNNICRDGDTASCLLGHNARSWSLECSEGSYTPCHGNKRFKSSSPQPFTRRVGVYLDWSAGALSFYCVSRETMVHLHTFTSSFSEPLYPGFWVWAYEGSVTLCQVELDWERLLQ